MALKAVGAMPRRAVTRAAGWLASRRVAGWLRAPAYRGYARAVGADLSEMRDSLVDFDTFNDFFKRSLRDGVRPVDRTAVVASPADGRLDQLGTIRAGRIVQAKGITYSVAELIADPLLAAELEGGTFATVYLSPADYHRVHAPFDFDVHTVRHLGGDVWPVNGISVPHLPDLFVLNERVVFAGRCGPTPAAVVMVAATVVGGIEVAHRDVPAPTDRRAGCTETTLRWPVERGAELGAFVLGSTAVVLLGPAVRCAAVRSAGSRVRVGEGICRLEGRDS